MRQGEKSVWRIASLAGTVVLGLMLSVPPSPARAACLGDCKNLSKVTVDNVVTMTRIALGQANVSECQNGVGSDGNIHITEIFTAVGNALYGCPVVPSGKHCGNGTVEPDKLEDCDIGGTCIGGTNAGRHCTAEGQCIGLGVCIGGTKIETACADSSECPGSECVRCVTQSGPIPGGSETCAANCTLETSSDFVLVKGVVEGGFVKEGTSAAIVNGNSLQIQLPLEGRQVTRRGKRRNGKIPTTTVASSVRFPKILVGNNLACACVRGAAAKTCGGTVFLQDGKLAADCTPGFDSTPDPCTDPGKNPCTFVHGEGLSATGTVSCDAGLQGIDLLFTQDDKGGFVACTSDTDPACVVDGEQRECVDHEGDIGKICAPAKPILTFSGTGGPGATIVINSTGIGQKLGGCTPTFCTDADPLNQRGQAATLPLTTGTASGMWFNVNGNNDETLCLCGNPNDLSCSLDQCVGPEGVCPTSQIPCPISVTGHAKSCEDIEAGNATGLSFAGSFNAPAIPTVFDAVITNTLVGQ